MGLAKRVATHHYSTGVTWKSRQIHCCHIVTHWLSLPPTPNRETMTHASSLSSRSLPLTCGTGLILTKPMSWWFRTFPSLRILEVHGDTLCWEWNCLLQTPTEWIYFLNSLFLILLYYFSNRSQDTVRINIEKIHIS